MGVTIYLQVLGWSSKQGPFFVGKNGWVESRWMDETIRVDGLWNTLLVGSSQPNKLPVGRKLPQNVVNSQGSVPKMPYRQFRLSYYLDLFFCWSVLRIRSHGIHHHEKPAFGRIVLDFFPSIEHANPSYVCLGVDLYRRSHIHPKENSGREAGKRLEKENTNRPQTTNCGGSMLVFGGYLQFSYMKRMSVFVQSDYLSPPQASRGF